MRLYIKIILAPRISANIIDIRIETITIFRYVSLMGVFSRFLFPIILALGCAVNIEDKRIFLKQAYFNFG